jgi:hypothetical protein
LPDENKSVWSAPKRALKPIRRWFDAKEVRPKLKPFPEPKKSAIQQPTYQYRACEDHDQAFTPRWRAEPVSYAGRGIVYLFESEAAAEEFVKQKNEEAAKRK